MEVRLLELLDTPNDEGWGHERGREVQEKLRYLVDKKPNELIVRLSLDGIKKADASFCREGLLHLAKLYRGKRGFCLVNVANEDLLENIDAAAGKFEQPIIFWHDSNPIILGKQPSEGLKETLNYVLSVPVTYTNDAAHKLALKVPNVSNKLNNLWKEGYILRREKVAISGGVEHAYFRIK